MFNKALLLCLVKRRKIQYQKKLNYKHTAKWISIIQAMMRVLRILISLEREPRKRLDRKRNEKIKLVQQKRQLLRVLVNSYRKTSLQ